MAGKDFSKMTDKELLAGGPLAFSAWLRRIRELARKEGIKPAEVTGCFPNGGTVSVILDHGRRPRPQPSQQRS